MNRTLKIVALSIGLAAVTLLGILGFAIWVFIPILPAGIIVFLAVMSTRRKQAKQDIEDDYKDDRKAA